MVLAERHSILGLVAIEGFETEVVDSDTTNLDTRFDCSIIVEVLLEISEDPFLLKISKQSTFEGKIHSKKKKPYRSEVGENLEEIKRQA